MPTDPRVVADVLRKYDRGQYRKEAEFHDGLADLLEYEESLPTNRKCKS